MGEQLGDQIRASVRESHGRIAMLERIPHENV
jgi:hypothetical protein